jgi:DNA-binding PadR family transcriptional regulator
MAARQRSLTLSDKERLILELLSSGEERYGLEMVDASGGRLKRGTIYVTLGRMEDKGFITSRLSDEPTPGGGLPLRLYQPTALGRRVLAVSQELTRHLIPEYGS